MTEAESTAAINRDYANSVAAVLDTYEGRAVLWELLTRCGLYGTSFAGEATHTMAFKEGKRDIGKQTFFDIENTSGDAYGVMRKEHLARVERYHVEPGKKETDE